MTTAQGKNFASDELKQLCMSWMHISQDPVVGSSQKNQSFWDRVGVHYNSHRPTGGEVRGAWSLESKWSDVKHDVSKFYGAFTRVVDLDPSGNSLEDLLRKAGELYTKQHPKRKTFGYMECWYLLKDNPRFLQTVDEMKGRSKQKPSPPTPIDGNVGVDKENTLPSDCDNSPDSINCEGGSIGFKRPPGNKSTKEFLKKQKEDENSLRISAKAQQDMATVSARRVKILEDQALQNLFSMKSDDIDEDCKLFFQLRRKEELAKLTARLSHSTPEQLIASTSILAIENTLSVPDPVGSPEYATTEVEVDVDHNDINVLDDANSWRK